MTAQFRKILCPVDFDDNSMQALDTAANLARESNGTVFVLHVVPIIIEPTGMPVYVDLYKGQEETAQAKLLEIAHKRLGGIKYELLIHTGEPAGSILNAEKKIDADVVVMATHGRRGFKRFLLGSIAEVVLRESTCPVLTVRCTPNSKRHGRHLDDEKPCHGNSAREARFYRGKHARRRVSMRADPG